MPEIFKGIKGFDQVKQLHPSDMKFEASKQRNADTVQIDAGSFFFMLLIVIFTLLVLVSSFASWRTAKIEEEEKLERRRERKIVQRVTDGEVITGLSESPGESDKTPARDRRRRPKKPKTHMQRVMKALSVQTTMKKLFTQRSPLEDDRDLEAFNGIRVICLCAVILGNTYFYILKGPLQNIEVIQEWMEGIFFGLVIQAELIVDIFFWLSAFLASYFMLVHIHNNSGSLGSWPRIYIKRVVRILPAYAFTLFFFWKVLVLFGGDGPRFFMYEEST